MTGKGLPWPIRQHEGRTLNRSDEVLNIAFSHDRSFSSSCPGIKGNVAIDIQSEALTMVEWYSSICQRNSPPWTDEGHTVLTLQKEQPAPGTGWTCPDPATSMALRAVCNR